MKKTGFIMTGYEKTDSKKYSFIKKKDRGKKKRETGYEKKFFHNLLKKKKGTRTIFF